MYKGEPTKGLVYFPEIVLEERGNDSTSELKISPDEDLVNQLPEEMISKLTDRFYEFIQEK